MESPPTGGQARRNKLFVSWGPLVIAAPLAGSLLAPLRCAAPCPSRARATWQLSRYPSPSQAAFVPFVQSRCLSSAGRASRPERRRAWPGVLSCPAMISIRTVCRHCLANAQVCPTVAVWGDHTGETMAKLLNELGRGKPAIPPSFTPCPLALADRDRREALRDQQSLTAAFFGDPLPGMSALDRRERERPH